MFRPPGEAKPVEINLSDMSFEEWQKHRHFFMWVILCGRGFGKSWTGSSWINEGAKNATGEFMGLMGRDAHDVRAFMVEGDSGIMATASNDFMPVYSPTNRLITWPNGVKAQIFYAEEPKTVRGPNNFRAWVDEPASFKDAHLGLKGPNGEDTAMSNLLMTCRKGEPQILVTGTPKPYKLIKDLLGYAGAVIVRGGTNENRDNLSDRWMKEMEDQYEGTRLGRQELLGEVLDDNPGALWRRSWIEANRVEQAPVDLERIVVAIDPSASASSESAETGIIVAARWMNPITNRHHYYILEDATVRGASPEEWAKTAVGCFRRWLADMLVAEKNNGGDMIESTLHTVNKNLPVTLVWASRGKITRAEPVSALYEQDRVHHVGKAKSYELLEDQMCEWEPGMPSPDRMDALVWAITDLCGGFSWSWDV